MDYYENLVENVTYLCGYYEKLVEDLISPSPQIGIEELAGWYGSQLQKLESKKKQVGLGFENEEAWGAKRPSVELRGKEGEIKDANSGAGYEDSEA